MNEFEVVLRLNPFRTKVVLRIFMEFLNIIDFIYQH